MSCPHDIWQAPVDRVKPLGTGNGSMPGRRARFLGTGARVEKYTGYIANSSTLIMRDRRYSRVAFSQLYACEDRFGLIWQRVRCHTRRSLERKQPRVNEVSPCYGPYPREVLDSAITPSSKRTRSFARSRRTFLSQS